jgi:hypothetical protein
MQIALTQLRFATATYHHDGECRAFFNKVIPRATLAPGTGTDRALLGVPRPGKYDKYVLADLGAMLIHELKSNRLPSAGPEGSTPGITK